MNLATYLLLVLMLLVCLAMVVSPAVIYIRSQAAVERQQRAAYQRDIEEIGAATAQFSDTRK